MMETIISCSLSLDLYIKITNIRRHKLCKTILRDSIQKIH